MKQIKCPLCLTADYYYETSTGKDKCTTCGELLDVGVIESEQKIITQLRKENELLRGVIEYIRQKTESIQKNIGRLK